MKRTNRAIRIVGILLPALFTPKLCFAGVQPGSITFVRAAVESTSVPTLGGTMLILLALLLAFIAFRSMRTRHGEGTLHTTIVTMLFAAALASSGLGVNLLRDAGASAGNVIVDDPDPRTFSIFSAVINSYSNKSGDAVRVQSRRLPEPCPSPDATDPPCSVNAIIPNASECFVDCSIRELEAEVEDR